MTRPFDYAAPRSLDELLGLLARHRHDARLLAGGTDLLVDVRAGTRVFAHAIDVKRVAGAGEIVFRKGSGLEIGMAATMADLAADRDCVRRYPILVQAALEVGSPQIRNRATAVGNICTASPCADLGRALLALDAACEVASKRGGVRVVPLAEFWTGVKRTLLEPDECVTRLLVPAAWADASGGNEKLKRIRGHDLAVASVTLAAKGDLLRVAVGSAAPRVVVVEKPRATAVDAILKAVDQAIRPIDDVRASAEYRRYMVGVFTRRLLGRLPAKRAGAKGGRK